MTNQETQNNVYIIQGCYKEVDGSLKLLAKHFTGTNTLDALENAVKYFQKIAPYRELQDFLFSTPKIENIQQTQQTGTFIQINQDNAQGHQIKIGGDSMKNRNVVVQTSKFNISATAINGELNIGDNIKVEQKINSGENSKVIVQSTVGNNNQNIAVNSGTVISDYVGNINF